MPELPGGAGSARRTGRLARSAPQPAVFSVLSRRPRSRARGREAAASSTRRPRRDSSAQLPLEPVDHARLAVLKAAAVGRARVGGARASASMRTSGAAAQIAARHALQAVAAGSGQRMVAPAVHAPGDGSGRTCRRAASCPTRGCRSWCVAVEMRGADQRTQRWHVAGMHKAVDTDVIDLLRRHHADPRSRHRRAGRAGWRPVPAHARLQSALDKDRAVHAERLKAYGDAEAKLREAFQALSADALKTNNEAFLTLAETRLREARTASDRRHRRAQEGDRGSARADGEDARAGRPRDQGLRAAPRRDRRAADAADRLARHRRPGPARRNAAPHRRAQAARASAAAGASSS